MPFTSRAIIVLFAMWLAAPLVGAEPSAAYTDAQRQAWESITRLGSDNYAARLEAKVSLMSLGRASIEPLEFAIKSDDPEVRAKALEILIALRGRGFLGIGLQEEMGDDEQDSDKPHPPNVIASQVVNFRQYAEYGVTKPFPAEAAGIQAGDKIRAVNDRPVRGTKDLMREVIAIGPARSAIITVERADKIMRMPVTLTRNPSLRTTQFGQPVRDVAPPVDLEKELDAQSPQKTSVDTATEPLAQARNQQPVQPGVNVQIIQINNAQGVRIIAPQPAQK